MAGIMTWDSASEIWLACIVAVFVVTIAWLYWRSTVTFGYWKSRGVAFVPAMPFFGSVPKMILNTAPRSEELRRLYDGLRGHPFGGFFLSTKPVLLVRDLDLVRRVLIEDFNHFVDRFAPPKDDGNPMALNLFQACGATWRVLRKAMTPAFSVGKIKKMVGTMRESSERLCASLKGSAQAGSMVDAKEFARNFALDVIGSCVYGLDLNCIQHSDHVVKKMSLDSTSLSWRLVVASFLAAKVPTINFCGLKSDVVNYFWNLAEKSMKHRERESVPRKDFLDILMKLKERGFIETDATEDATDSFENGDSHILKDPEETNIKITDDLVAAQCLIFFIAGFETSSAAIGFCLYELALNPDIQHQLRGEILRVLPKYDGNLCYAAVQEMTYLQQVVSETLRKHPPASTIVRTCTKPYTIPGTDVRLRVGDSLLVPIPGIHHDEDIYPDPERFDPDRFSEEQVRRRHRYSFLPFGVGPRGCVGKLFGNLQVKVAVASLISRYQFLVCSRTPIPLVLDTKHLAKTAAGGMWLKITTAPQDGL